MRGEILLILALVAGCTPMRVEQPEHISFKPPKIVGDALPTPTTPLRDIPGILGAIPSADQETLDLYVRNFEKIEFTHEYGGEAPWVTKWNSLVRLEVEKNPEIRKALWSAADTLGKITGLRFTEGPAEKVTIFSDREGMDPGGGDKYCFALIANRSDGSIDMGFIFVGKDMHGGFLTTCIIEELSQLMGPTNDSDLVEESLWRPQTLESFFAGRKFNALTWHDAIALRVLYNERIKPGMPKSDAMPIVRELIAKELRDLNAGT